MQPSDFMRPPGYCDLAPLGQDGRMMLLLLGKLPYLHREGERLGKIGKRERAHQARDAVPIFDLPIRDQGQELGHLRRRDARRIPAAGDTLFPREIDHRTSSSHVIRRISSTTSAWLVGVSSA